MADTTTGIDWQQLLQGLGPLISGGLSLGSANTISSLGNQYADIADPFRGQRPQYQTAMQNLISGRNPVTDFLANPASLHTMPGYESGMNAGIEAVNRARGSQQMAASGNRLTDLYKFGNQFDLNWQNQIFNQLQSARAQQFGELLPLTGATSGQPGYGAIAASNGTQQTGQSLGAGIAGISGAVGSILNSGVLSKLPQVLQGLIGGTLDPNSPEVTQMINDMIGPGPGMDYSTDFTSLFGGGAASDLLPMQPFDFGSFTDLLPMP